MSYLNSDDLLDLLVRERLLTAAQRQFILLNQAKQRLKLLKHHGRRQEDEYRQAKGFPDLVDIILSLGLETADRPPQPISEEMIMLAVSRGFDIPFKKLDPLELDMNVVTKTIPRSFAIRHLILPISLDNGVLEVATYYPDNENALEDIERANQVTVRPYLSTKTDLRKILAEFFGFQRSITAAESQFGGVGPAAPVDIGNLEQYVRLASAKELSSTDQHIKAAVNHLFSYALEQRASDIHIEPKRDVCMVRYRIDGVLHTIYKLPKAVHSAITSRVKSLARMDIAEKRRPQDGGDGAGGHLDRRGDDAGQDIGPQHQRGPDQRRAGQPGRAAFTHQPAGGMGGDQPDEADGPDEGHGGAGQQDRQRHHGDLGRAKRQAGRARAVRIQPQLRQHPRRQRDQRQAEGQDHA